MKPYKERLKISLTGNDSTEFYTKSGTLVATGYTRIVIGQRGPYVEFGSHQIKKENINVPKDQEYRMTDGKTYYNEWRTKDSCFVKLYEQKKSVSYADYKVGLWYISPFDLKTKELETLVQPIQERESSVFDI